MSSDVKIKSDELIALSNKLQRIILELKEASHRADRLEDAIGDPWGKNRLREAAEEFEDGWDDRRRDLLRDIKKVDEHILAVLEGFDDWDRSTLMQLNDA